MWNLVKGVMAASAIFMAAKGMMDAIKVEKASEAAKIVVLKLVEVSAVCGVLMAGAIGAAISMPWWLVGVSLYMVSFAAMHFSAKIAMSDAAANPNSAINAYNEMMNGVEVEVELKKEEEGNVKPA